MPVPPIFLSLFATPNAEAPRGPDSSASVRALRYRDLLAAHCQRAHPALARETFALIYAAGGAPRLRSAGHRLALSLSHTDDVLVVATQQRTGAGRQAVRLGVDIERRTRLHCQRHASIGGPCPEAAGRAARLARRWLPLQVARRLAQLPPALRTEAFLRAWILWEAYAKWTERGVPRAKWPSPAKGLDPLGFANAGKGGSPQVLGTQGRAFAVAGGRAYAHVELTGQANPLLVAVVSREPAPVVWLP